MPVPDETEIVNSLFEEGLECFHLRKPGYSVDQLEKFITGIKPGFVKRIVINSHYELITKYNLMGFHFTNAFLTDAQDEELKQMSKLIKIRGLSLSSSVHIIDELRNLKFKYNYVFLSPVFNSISKKGYFSHLKLEEISFFLKRFTLKTKVYASGGVDADKIKLIAQAGFDGVGVLGDIWEYPGKEVARYLKLQDTCLNTC